MSKYKATSQTKIKLFIGYKDGERFEVDAEDLVTQRTCVIGQSGSGKSYLIGVICEELAKNSLGFCVIDFEGEYYGLKERYGILWVGAGKDYEINIEEYKIEEIANELVKNEIPCIFDVSEIEYRKVLTSFFTSVFNAASRFRNPYLLIVEETDKIVPQSGERIKKFEEIARRGRKRGLGILVATQRPALVSKDILSQCSNQFVGKLVTEPDIKAVTPFFTKRSFLRELPNLKPGEFFALGTLGNLKIIVRKRETKHIGYTPALKPRKESIENIIRKLCEKKVEKEVFYVKPNNLELKEIGFIKKRRILKKEIVYYPIFEINLIRGNKEMRLYVDGILGKQFTITKLGKVSFKYLFDDLIELSAKEIKILKAIYELREASAREISEYVGFSISTVRNVLKSLESKGKIAVYENKSRKYYLAKKIKISRMKGAKMALVARKGVIKERVAQSRISSENLKEIIRGLGFKGVIGNIKLIHYPFYVIRLEGCSKPIILDGVFLKKAPNYLIQILLPSTT